MVLNPSLITHSIDVVIGEYIYELHFKVEQEELVNPVPIDMDDDVMDDREDDGAERNNEPKTLQLDMSAQKSGKQNTSTSKPDEGGQSSQLSKKLAFSLPALEMILGTVQGAQQEGDEEFMGVEVPNSEPSSPIINAVHLAAIPETESPGRSKRRAELADESSLECAERIKVAHNLDFRGKTNSAQFSFLQFSNVDVMNKLDVVGINLDHDHTTIGTAISDLRQVEQDRVVCVIAITWSNQKVGCEQDRPKR
jgi:hypothetical protein